MIPSYTIEATFFGQYISENLPGKKVGVLYENNDQGIDDLAGVKDGLDPAKNEIVSEQTYEVTAISISSQVTNLKNAGAEVVILSQHSRLHRPGHQGGRPPGLASSVVHGLRQFRRHAVPVRLPPDFWRAPSAPGLQAGGLDATIRP